MDSDDKSQMIEFAFSETFIRQARRQILVLIPFVTLFVVIFALYISSYVSDARIAPERALPAVGVGILIYVSILLIEMRLINWMQRKLKVFVGEDKLVKQCGRKQQMLSWTDIAAVIITRNKKGLAAQIRLQAEKPKESLYLHGFSDMEDLATLIRERTPDSIILREKSWRFNWENPFVGMLVAGVPTMVFMFIIASMGGKAIDVFGILCALSLGAGLLIFRPLTKYDIRYRWVEAAVAVLCLILGIHPLICFLRTGEIP